MNNSYTIFFYNNSKELYNSIVQNPLCTNKTLKKEKLNKKQSVTVEIVLYKYDQFVMKFNRKIMVGVFFLPNTFVN